MTSAAGHLGINDRRGLTQCRGKCTDYQQHTGMARTDNQAQTGSLNVQAMGACNIRAGHNEHIEIARHCGSDQPPQCG